MSLTQPLSTRIPNALMDRIREESREREVPLTQVVTERLERGYAETIPHPMQPEIPNEYARAMEQDIRKLCGVNVPETGERCVHQFLKSQCVTCHPELLK